MQAATMDLGRGPTSPYLRRRLRSYREALEDLRRNRRQRGQPPAADQESETPDREGSDSNDGSGPEDDA